MTAELYPVVHITNKAQAVDQAQVALEAGADGVYLVDDSNFYPYRLLDVYSSVSEANPSVFVGVNMLSARTPEIAFTVLLEAVTKGTIPDYPNALWTRDASISAEQTARLRQRYPELLGVEYYGGVAYKYTSRYTDVPEAAALEAHLLKGFVDVVTTSGDINGHPPSLDKVIAIKREVGEQALAVASGLNPMTIADYAGIVTKLIVTTSLNTDPGSSIFDGDELADLIDTAHNL